MNFANAPQNSNSMYAFYIPSYQNLQAFSYLCAQYSIPTLFLQLLPHFFVFGNAFFNKKRGCRKAAPKDFWNALFAKYKIGKEDTAARLRMQADKIRLTEKLLGQMEGERFLSSSEFAA